MSRLFSPLTLRGTTFRNRVWAAPMCQYSSELGFPNDWHLAHLGGLARGGSGLVMQEATAVTPGAGSPADAGIWDDERADARERIVFVRSQGAIPVSSSPTPDARPPPSSPGSATDTSRSSRAAGRRSAPHPCRSATGPPRRSSAPTRSWAWCGPSPTPPAGRGAGYAVAEVHGGYLLHQFLSPLANHRTDDYGGDLEGRSRFLVQVGTRSGSSGRRTGPCSSGSRPPTGRRAVGRRGDRRAGPPARVARCRPDRRDQRWPRARRQDRGRAGLPGAVRPGRARGGGRRCRPSG